MKRKLLLIFLIVSASLQAQQTYLKTGVNHTSYHYKSASGERSNYFQSELGKAYEIGYKFHLLDSLNLFCDAGLVFNEYNQIVGVPNAMLKWKTGYVGIQSTIFYPVVNLKSFSIDVKAGGGLNTILYGKQDINGVIYDIKDNKDFNGAVFHILLGLQANLKASEYCHLSIGYNYLKTINTLKNPEQFYIKSSQIMLGIHLASVKKQTMKIKS